MRKSLLVLVTVFALVLSMVAFASAKTLIVAQGSDPVTLDPQGQNDQPSARVRVQIFETLVNQDNDLNIVPGLATSWEQISPTVWEFKLREGVKFHNGDEFTADDVKYSLERVKDPQAYLSCSKPLLALRSWTRTPSVLRPSTHLLRFWLTSTPIYCYRKPPFSRRSW